MPVIEIYDRRTGKAARAEDGYKTLVAFPPDEDPDCFGLRVRGEDVDASVHFMDSGSATVYFRHWQRSQIAKLNDVSLSDLLHSPVASLYWPIDSGAASECGVFKAAEAMMHAYARAAAPDSEIYWDGRLIFDAALQDWAFPWTFYESIAAIGIASAKDVAFPPLSYSPSVSDDERPGVSFDFELPETDRSFGEVMRLIEGRVAQIFSDAASALHRIDDHIRVSAAFDFPEPIRAACEQYLVYFGQFLRDLGIDASTELREQAGAVLFQVTPNGGSDALQRIREALDVYLNLPGNPGFPDAANSTEVAVQQLIANVFHLKSQLALSQAIIQAKDAAIQSYQITNAQLLQRIPQLSSGEKGAAEPIIGEFVSVTKYDEHGVQVNFANIVRSLKRRLRRSE